MLPLTALRPIRLWARCEGWGHFSAEKLVFVPFTWRGDSLRSRQGKGEII
jgi:hypothetical protein